LGGKRGRERRRKKNFIKGINNLKYRAGCVFLLLKHGYIPVFYFYLAVKKIHPLVLLLCGIVFDTFTCLAICVPSPTLFPTEFSSASDLLF